MYHIHRLPSSQGGQTALVESDGKTTGAGPADVRPASAVRYRTTRLQNREPARCPCVLLQEARHGNRVDYGGRSHNWKRGAGGGVCNDSRYICSSVLLRNSARWVSLVSSSGRERERVRLLRRKRLEEAAT